MLSEDSYDKMEERIKQAILASGQRKVRVVYSCYDDNDNGVIVDHLDDIAASGEVVLVSECDDYWGGAKSRNYESPPLTNPTWIEVCVYANRAIRRTRDTHHCFLEGIERRDNTNVYDLVFGS